MSEPNLKILTQSQLFNGINQMELKSMLQCLQPRVNNYSKHQFITNAGEQFEYLGIMLQGEATVSKENAAGNRVMMHLLKPGDLFGEMVVFSGEPRWPATVQAQQECEVLFVARAKIVGECEKVCPWHQRLIQNMLKIISERALMLNKKVEYLTIKSMRGKISTYLLEQYQQTGSLIFMLPVNRNELADFLNVSRPSMSRELGRMRDEGIIDFHLTSVRIIDLEALKRMLNSG